MKIYIKNLITIILFILLFASQLFADAEGGSLIIESPEKVYKISGDWYFKPDDRPEYSKFDFDDSKWKIINSNDNWTSYPEFKNYKGLGWYRLHLTIKEKADYAIYVSESSSGLQIYLNGELIGETRPALKDGKINPIKGKPFITKIPNSLIKSEKNILAIRIGVLDNFSGFSNTFFGRYKTGSSNKIVLGKKYSVKKTH